MIKCGWNGHSVHMPIQLHVRDINYDFTSLQLIIYSRKQKVLGYIFLYSNSIEEHSMVMSVPVWRQNSMLCFDLALTFLVCSTVDGIFWCPKIPLFHVCETHPIQLVWKYQCSCFEQGEVYEEGPSSDSYEVWQWTSLSLYIVLNLSPNIINNLSPFTLLIVYMLYLI